MLELLHCASKALKLEPASGLVVHCAGKEEEGG